MAPGHVLAAVGWFNDEVYAKLRRANFPSSRKNSTPVLLNRWSMPGFYVCQSQPLSPPTLARQNRTRTRAAPGSGTSLSRQQRFLNPQGGTAGDAPKSFNFVDSLPFMFSPVASPHRLNLRNGGFMKRLFSDVDAAGLCGRRPTAREK